MLFRSCKKTITFTGDSLFNQNVTLYEPYKLYKCLPQPNKLSADHI